MRSSLALLLAFASAAVGLFAGRELWPKESAHATHVVRWEPPPEERPQRHPSRATQPDAEPRHPTDAEPPPAPTNAEVSADGTRVSVAGGEFKVVFVGGRWQLKKHGPWVRYYRNGHKRDEGEYRDGKRVGLWRTYHESNGALFAEVNCVDGKQDGPYKSWHDNGAVANISTYIHGKPEGPSTNYHLNGNPAELGQYKDGRREGTWTRYYEDGRAYLERYYKKGKELRPQRLLDGSGDYTSEAEAQHAATVKGKYRGLLMRIPAPDDTATYKKFKDYGEYTATNYKGHGVPKGYWVYVWPCWYVFAEKVG